jgi:hypothetical protein
VRSHVTLQHGPSAQGGREPAGQLAMSSVRRVHALALAPRPVAATEVWLELMRLRICAAAVSSDLLRGPASFITAMASVGHDVPFTATSLINGQRFSTLRSYPRSRCQTNCSNTSLVQS